MYEIALLLHLLAATVWTGGHLVLAIVVLPQVLKQQSPEMLLSFEMRFEKLGMPALMIQIISGLVLANYKLPSWDMLLDISNPITHPVLAKLLLLAMTFALALDAKLRVLPKLSNNNLWDMAAHIIAVTLFSVLFVIVGISFRTGWLY